MRALLLLPVLASTLLPSAPPKPELRTLAFLGDSLTAGYGVEMKEAFPARIEARMKQKGLTWKVINAGLSGDTTAGGLRRLDALLRQPIEVLFLCLGANDGLRGLPLATTEQNLRAIIDRAQARGIRVVLAGMDLPENYGPEYRKGFRALYSRLAKEKKTPFIPFLLEDVAMRPELNQEDRIHPNAAGHERVAARVWKTLEPVLARP
jgi:acyl-CoA thioesterase-1